MEKFKRPMMQNLCAAALLVATLALQISTVHAEDTLYPDIFPPLPWTFKTEREKVDFVARVMRKAKRIELGIGYTSCNKTMESLEKGNKAIIAIEPVIHAGSASDSQLNKITNLCPNLHFFDAFTFDQGVLDDDPSLLSYEEKIRLGNRHSMTGRVLFYRLGRIGKIQNLVSMYGEKVCKENPGNDCTNDQYNFIDLNNCEEVTVEPVAEIYNVYLKKPKARLSTLVRTKHDMFVLMFMAPVVGSERGFISLTSLKKKIGNLPPHWLYLYSIFLKEHRNGSNKITSFDNKHPRCRVYGN